MIKPIVTNIKELRKPCALVTKDDDIKGIIQDLKDTLEAKKYIGLSANQIGINKRISYIKIIKSINPQTKEINYAEIILINPKITEKTRKIQVKGEQCASFLGLRVDTERYVFISVVNHNEKLEPQTFLAQDLESIAIQHEYAHLIGRTIIDDKWRGR